MENPSVIIALAPEGVNRRRKMLEGISAEALVVKASGIELPQMPASIIEIDFKAEKIKTQDWALAALAVLARRNNVLTMDMLKAALMLRFRKAEYDAAIALMEMAAALP